MKVINTFKPQAVADISYWLLYENDVEQVYSVGSITRDRYLKIKVHLLEPIMIAIKYFDGMKSISEIQELLLVEHNLDLDVQGTVDTLAKADLMINNPEGIKVERQEFDKFFIKIISIPISTWSNWLSSFGKNLYDFIRIISFLVIIPGIVALLLAGRELFEFRNYLISESIGTSILVTLPIFITFFILHELGHAIVATRSGLKPSNLVIGLYGGFSGMVYLKIPGIYTLKKSQKIKLWLAGIYTNFFMVCLFSLISLCMLPNEVETIVNLIILVNIGFIIANISPFLPLDGYYLISTLFNLPNLRKNSFSGMGKVIFEKNHKFNLKCIYCIYLILSVVFMVAIISFQLQFIFNWFSNELIEHGNMLEVIINSKVIMGLICIVTARSLIFGIKQGVTKMKEKKEDNNGKRHFES